MKEEDIKMMEINPEDKENLTSQLVIGVLISRKIMTSNPQLEQLRLSGNKEEFSKLFRELFKVEKENLNLNELWKNELQKKN
jgi:hypothetical protein